MTRFILLGLALVMVESSTASIAQTPKEKLIPRAQVARPMPLKPAPSSSCAEFGAGFVRVEGSNTCVKVGGAVAVGAGMAR